VPDTSGNWSGYAVTGGPYTAISSTFTIPYITSAAACSDDVDTWIGIDGFYPPNATPDTSLIQAGIDASDTNPTTGDCTPGTFWVWPWWEVLPAPEQLPTNWTGASVSAGDEVTVNISQVSGATWNISLTDDTSGGSFNTETSFSGTAATAEWIVEAATNNEQCGVGGSSGVCPLAPYSDANGNEPGVTFSNLGISPPSINTWYQITMVQDGGQVSAPSNYSTNGQGGATGFTVSYTGDQESAPLAPALVPISKMPKGKFLHPIYHHDNVIGSNVGSKALLGPHSQRRDIPSRLRGRP
jgi:hypothetical protein